MLRNAFVPLAALGTVLFPTLLPAQQTPPSPSPAAAVTTPNTPTAERKAWQRRLQKYEFENDKDPSFLYELARANPDVIHDVILAWWKPEQGEDTHILQVLVNGTTGSANELETEPGGTPPLPHPYLLDLLALGMQEKNRYQRRQTAALVTSLSGIRFAGREAFTTWRSGQQGKTLEALVREGMQNLAQRFVKADLREKDDLFDTLHDILPALRSQPASSSSNKRLEDLAAVRRRALREAGLLDALIPLLQDKSDPERADNALELLAALRPDAAVLSRIEPEARRLLEARLQRRDTLTLPLTDLLLAAPAEWAMPLLVRFLERDYLNADGVPILNALCAAEDIRALPLLIALIPTRDAKQARVLHNAAARLAGVPAEPQRDAAAWREWWTQNHATLPEPACSLALPQFKAGAESLAERLLSTKGTYRFDESDKRTLLALTPEQIAAATEAVWPRETGDNRKAELLQCLLVACDKSPSASHDRPLLDSLHLGMMDDSAEVQQAASQMLLACCFRQFSDYDPYLLWRKRNAGKSLAELRRDGLRDFTARFLKAKEADQPGLLDLFDTLYAYAPSVERDYDVVLLPNLLAQTGKALDEAGFSTQMLPLLHAKDEATVQKALRYFSVFLPDAAWMERNEEAVRAAYTRLLAHPDANIPPFQLLLACHKPWVGAMLADYVQRASVSGSGHNSLLSVAKIHDPRILPLAMAFIPTVMDWQQNPIMKNLLEQTGYPDDAPKEPAGWRKWWETHRAEQPEEAQAVPFLTLLSGSELVSTLLAHATERDWYLLQMVQQLDPETRFKVVRDNWKNIKDDDMRWLLLLEYDPDRYSGDETSGEIPHYLELLELAVNDKSARVSQIALNLAAPLAIRQFKEAKPFYEWHVQVLNKPLTEIVRARANSLIAAIEKADDKTLPDLLEQARYGTWYSQLDDYSTPLRRQHIVVAGRAAVCRKVAEETFLLDYLASRLKPGHTPEVYTATLQFLMVYHPDTAFMDRIAPDVRQAIATVEAAKKPLEGNILSMLNYYDTDWAADILRREALSQFRTGSQGAIYSVMNADNPHLIPLLIAVLASDDVDSWVQSELNGSLCRMAHIHRSDAQDAVWWRAWWEENRPHLPETVRVQSIPSLEGDPQASKMFSIRRGRKQTQIGTDSRRRYWLVSSGLLLSKPRPPKLLKGKTAGKTVTAKATAKPKPPAPRPPAGDFPDFPYADRPGLLVVLTDDTDDLTTQTHYWQDVASKGFGGKYLVALAIAPNAKAGQIPRWPTRRENKAAVPFTTETLTADIVRDVRTHYPVNPARVLLLGVGTAGQAAYAASLEPQTPFRGFVILDAAFRMGVLPSLVTAKGRHYVLLHDPQQKQPPYLVAKIAVEALQRAGATPHLTPCPQEPDALHRATWEQIAEAIRWLEGK